MQFASNIYSRRSTPLYPLSPTSAQGKLFGRISRDFYGIHAEHISAPEREGFPTASTVKIEAKKHGVRPEFFLKQYRDGIDESRVETIIKTIDHCFEHGAPVPRILPTKEGKKYVRARMGSKYVFFSASELIAGGHYDGSAIELEELGSGLGKLHATLGSLPFSASIREQKTILGTVYTEQRYLEVMNNLANLSSPENELESLLLNERPLLAEKMTWAVQFQSSMPKSSMTLQVIHRDLHPHNALFEAGRLTAIYDFDQVCWSELSRCIGFSLYSFVRQRIVHVQPKDERGIKHAIKEAIQLFIKKYDSEYILGRVDAMLVRPMIDLEMLARIVRVVNLYYEDGKNSPRIKDMAHEVASGVDALKEARYFPTSL